jgi:hypothetical protein
MLFLFRFLALDRCIPRLPHFGQTISELRRNMEADASNALKSWLPVNDFGDNHVKSSSYCQTVFWIVGVDYYGLFNNMNSTLLCCNPLICVNAMWASCFGVTA